MSRRAQVLAAALLLLLAGCDADVADRPARSAAAGPACDAAAPLRVDARLRVGAGVGPMTLDGATLWAARPAAGTIVPIGVDAAPRAGAPIRVGGAPVSIAAGLGEVWVADRDRDRILRVSPKSRRVRMLAGIDAPVKVVLADGTLYVISLDDGAIYSMNPRDAAGLRDLAIPLRAPVDAVRQGGDLWLLGGSDHGVTPFHMSSSRFLRAGVQMPAPVVGAIAAGQGAVWVALPTDGSVVRIDPVTNAIGPVRASPGLRPGAVAVDDCGVWVGDADGRVQRLDPVTARPFGGAIRIGRSVGALVADRGGVWASDPRGGTLVRVSGRR